MLWETLQGAVEVGTPWQQIAFGFIIEQPIAITPLTAKIGAARIKDMHGLTHVLLCELNDSEPIAESQGDDWDY